MDRNVLLVILNVLYWYAMCSAVVQWNSMFSSVVQLQCGLGRVECYHVFYFALYVNDLILALSRSSHGCYFNMFLGCDASLCDLQSMINICCVELDKLDMKLNAKSHTGSFSEPVMQHVVNVHCEPYLMYGADVINWTQSELARATFRFVYFSRHFADSFNCCSITWENEQLVSCKMST